MSVPVAPAPVLPVAFPCLVLVMGGGDVGSAVAQQLFLAGHHVLLSEQPRSAHARRGMAFTDALFDGSTTLEGVEGRWQPDLAGARRCWEARDAVPIMTTSDDSLIAAFRFSALVDATMRRQRAARDLRDVVQCAIGLGPGHVPGRNCHAAIETRWGADMGRVLFDREPAERSGGPRALDGVTRERFVAAVQAGHWRTSAVLGQPVRAGDELGALGSMPVHAPIAGTLRGIAHDDVVVRAGQRLLEVDPRRSPEVYGLGERPRAIAAGVCLALQLLRSPQTPGAAP